MTDYPGNLNFMAKITNIFIFASVIVYHLAASDCRLRIENNCIAPIRGKEISKRQSYRIKSRKHELNGFCGYLFIRFVTRTGHVSIKMKNQISKIMQIIDGKKIADEIKAEIKAEVDFMKARGVRVPHLAAVLVGHDGGSETYVAHKVKACEQVGFKSTLVRYEDDVTEEELLRRIESLNADSGIDGFIVQLPLPKHIDEQKIIEAVSPAKDVDGFHPVNVGRMMIGLPCFVSATPAGIMELLNRCRIDTRGKHCVVLGRSNIVGKPVSMLMAQKSAPGDATVTICHSRTHNIPEITRQADIIIAAMGQPEFVTADMVKEGAVVIDVGTTRVPSSETKSGWKLKGDVKFDETAPKCSYITPVPGGVGPMTIVSLLRNTLKAAQGEVYTLRGQVL